jgi:SAM-dependent methyltransferase
MSQVAEAARVADPVAALKAAELAWDTIDVAKVRDVSWFSVPGVGRHIAHVTGNQPIHEIVAPFMQGRADLVGAAIACGDMVGERVIFDQFPFSRIDGYDISGESLRRAADSYAGSPVDFRPYHGDCNRLALSTRSYDLVLGWHGIHHIEAIDPLFEQIEQALTDDGVFMMYEWIGPKYLQIPGINAMTSRLLLRTLFRREERVTHEGKRKGRWLQQPPEMFEPSEAVNADRIHGALVERFDVLRKIVFGGLLYPMFEGLGANEHLATDSSTARRVGLVSRLERNLTRMGLIHPLFMISVARRRKAREVR